MKGLLFTDEGNKRGLVANVNWRAVRHHPKSVTKDIIEYAKLDGANRVVVHEVDAGAGGVQASVGTFVLHDDDDDVKTPKELHSVAGILVQAFPAVPHIVLAWRFGPKADKIAVIGIEGHMPVVDAVFTNDSDAKAMIQQIIQGKFGFKGHELFTNDKGLLPAAQHVAEETLLARCNKWTRLGKVPVNKAALLMMALTVLLVAGVATFGYMAKKDAERKKRLAEEAMRNPVPAYEAALAENINRMGMSRESLAKTIALVRQHPVWQSGWVLTKISCANQKCISSWERQGGTTNELTASRPGETMILSEDPNKIQLSWDAPIEMAGLGDRGNAMPLEEAKLLLINKFQTWRNTESTGSPIVIREGDAYQTWPVPTQGDVSRLPVDITLRSREIEVSVPEPLLDDMLVDTPLPVFFNSMEVRVQLTDKSNLLVYTFKGNSYVR